MKVELVYDKDSPVPTPYFIETNAVALDLLDFIIVRELHPRKISSKLRSANTKTLKDLLQRIVFLINQFAEQTFIEDGVTKVGINYKVATYENNMVPLIKALREDGDWKEDSIKEYVKAWRQFYRFLTYQGVDHDMAMPTTIERKVSQNTDSNFLSHTNIDSSRTIEQETAVDGRLTAQREDYCDKVISIEVFIKLYNELLNTDEVYAAMAYCSITTLLRAEALCSNFPISSGSSTLNPNFKPYPVAIRNARMNKSTYTKQMVNYKAKGGKVKTCIFPAVVHRVIHEQYINSGNIDYETRLKLFKTKYCKSKFAKKRGITKNMSFAWINKNGTPVNKLSFQVAIRKASKAIGIDIHPHMLRHTGATQVLYRYLCEIGHGTMAFINNLIINDVHKVLQLQLGHISVETTKLYVKTIERFHDQVKLDYLLNTTILLDNTSDFNFSSMGEHIKQGILAWEKGTSSLYS